MNPRGYLLPLVQLQLQTSFVQLDSTCMKLCHLLSEHCFTEPMICFLLNIKYMIIDQVFRITGNYLLKVSEQKKREDYNKKRKCITTIKVIIKFTKKRGLRCYNTIRALKSQDLEQRLKLCEPQSVAPTQIHNNLSAYLNVCS